MSMIAYLGLAVHMNMLFKPRHCIDKIISFAYVYNAALMEKLNISDVASYDVHFDRIEGIRRFEP